MYLMLIFDQQAHCLIAFFVACPFPQISHAHEAFVVVSTFYFNFLLIAKTQMGRKCQLILIGRQSKKTRKRRTAERRQCQHRRSCVCNRRVGVPTPM
jgi:hypothetical protein